MGGRAFQTSWHSKTLLAVVGKAVLLLALCWPLEALAQATFDDRWRWWLDRQPEELVQARPPAREGREEARKTERKADDPVCGARGRITYTRHRHVYWRCR